MPARITAMLAAALLAMSASQASAEDLVFMLDNQSSYTIVEFYASPEGVSNWEEDILGDDVLQPGAATRITIADGRTQCEYDMHFVFDDGETMEDSADLCDTGSYTVED